MYAEQASARSHEFDTLYQLYCVERLNDEIVGAGSNATVHILDRLARGQERDRDLRASGFVAPPSAHLKSINVWHVYVEHYQLRRHMRKHRKTFFAAGRAEDFIARLTPNALHQGDRIGVVVDDQDDLGVDFFSLPLRPREPKSFFGCSGGRSIHRWSYVSVPVRHRSNPHRR